MDISTFSENLYDYMESLVRIMVYVYLFNIINITIFRGIFNHFGIKPRHIKGLPGIICAPFLHASTEHFIMNAIPFFFISLMMVAILDWNLFYAHIEVITLLSGSVIWTLGRKGVHIGASGLVTGMFGWVLYWTMYHPTLINIVILSILVLYFGSIFLGVIPVHSDVSWEGHLAGLLVGIACAKYPMIMDTYYQGEIILLQMNFYIASLIPI